MLKRTIYIGNPTYLKLKDNQLKIEDPVTKEVKGSVPVEDMGFLVLDNPQITLSHPVILALQQQNVAIISCDESHLPLQRQNHRVRQRSEEHTSELQSRPHLVCRLLLEKK